MQLLKLDTALQATVTQHALLARQFHRRMCVSVGNPWGGLGDLCVCFSVKCSIGFRGFPQDLSPTIKIHLIFITPNCCCAFLILFLSASYLHLPVFYHSASLPAPLPLSFVLSTSPQLSLSLSLSLPARFIDARPVLSLFFCLAVHFSPLPCFVILNLSRSSISSVNVRKHLFLQAKLNVTSETDLLNTKPNSNTHIKWSMSSSTPLTRHRIQQLVPVH